MKSIFPSNEAVEESLFFENFKRFFGHPGRVLIMPEAREIFGEFGRHIVNVVYVGFLSAFSVLGSSQSFMDGLQRRWHNALSLQVVSSFFAVVDDRPNKPPMTPTRRGAEHHVIFDKTVDDLAKQGQLLKGCIAEFFSVEQH